MSDDLEERLRGALATAPPPDRPRERRARTAAIEAVPHSPRWPRRALRYAVPAVGFAGLAGFLILAAPRGQKAPGADGGTDIAVSVLNRPQGPEDHLPGWVAADPVVIANAIDPASVRRAGTSGGRLFFIARGRAFDRTVRERSV
jgi:hypothetical protein